MAITKILRPVLVCLNQMSRGRLYIYLYLPLFNRSVRRVAVRLLEQSLLITSTNDSESLTEPRSTSVTNAAGVDQSVLTGSYNMGGSTRYFDYALSVYLVQN